MEGYEKMRGRIANKFLFEAMKLPKGIGEQEFFANYCPPLPLNHEPQQDEPDHQEHHRDAE